jgi:hypothetical protein
MVPTEVLAVQHYQHLISLLDKIDGDECKPNIALLTGSTSTRESRMIRNVSCCYLVLTLKLLLCIHIISLCSAMTGSQSRRDSDDHRNTQLNS